MEKLKQILVLIVTQNKKGLGKITHIKYGVQSKNKLVKKFSKKKKIIRNSRTFFQLLHKIKCASKFQCTIEPQQAQRETEMRITVKCKTENFKNLKYWKLKRERERKGWKSSCKVYRVYTEATYLIDGYGFVGLDGKRLVWRKWIRPVVSLIWSRVQFQLNIMFENMRLFGKLAGFLLKRLLGIIIYWSTLSIWCDIIILQTFNWHFLLISRELFFFVYEIILFWTSNG